MGRQKKYNTDAERKAANNEKVKAFYWDNKKKLDLDASIRYWSKKIETLQSNGIDTSHPIYVKAVTKLSNFIHEKSLIEKNKSYIWNIQSQIT
jgi:hypothetical protein